MQKTTKTEPNSELEKNPFVNLVREADEVFIEEIPSQSKARHFFVSVDRLKKESASATAGNKSQEELLENAAVLLASHEYLLARHLFTAVLKRNLKQHEALKGLGICLLRLGDPIASRKCFRALWDLFGELQAAIGLAQCFASEKEDILALEWFRKLKVPALLNQLDRFEYYRELGNCFSRLGDYSEAESAYQKALEIQPKSDAVCANLGTLELQRGHLKVAASYFERALMLNPESTKAHAGMGIVAFQSQDFNLAARFFMKSLDLDSQNILALHQLIECGEHVAIFKELRNRIERYLEKEPLNHRIRFSLAALLYKENLWKESEMELDRILSQEPNYLNAKKLKEELKNSRKNI